IQKRKSGLSQIHTRDEVANAVEREVDARDANRLAPVVRPEKGNVVADDERARRRAEVRLAPLWSGESALEPVVGGVVVACLDPRELDSSRRARHMRGEESALPVGL